MIFPNFRTARIEFRAKMMQGSAANKNVHYYWVYYRLWLHLFAHNCRLIQKTIKNATPPSMLIYGWGALGSSKTYFLLNMVCNHQSVSEHISENDRHFLIGIAGIFEQVEAK